MRLATICAILVLGGNLTAQDSLNITGNVGDLDFEFLLYEIDFGGASQTIDLTLTIGATGGMSGLAADLIDLDALAASGSATGIESDFEFGTTQMVLNMSATHTGVVQFAVALETTDVNGPSPYSGTLAISAGSIVFVSRQTLGLEFNQLQFIQGRAVRFAANPVGNATFAHDITLNFGTTPQAITFYTNAFAFGTADFEFIEITETGTESLLGTLNNGGEANFTTSSRSGNVNIRVRIVATSADPKVWTCVFPSSVAFVPRGSGGGGGGGKDGCTVAAGGSLAPFVMLLLLARRRRQAA